MDQSISDFTLLFSIATGGMLVLALAIVFFVVFYQKKMLQEKLKQQAMETRYQQKMLESALESQENERRRVAADLHDSVGSMLATIKAGLNNLIRSNNPDDIEFTKSVLDETIISVRRIGRDLMPATLDQFGLSSALRELCERMQQVSGLQVSFLEKGEIHSLSLNHSAALYRIIQELLNNAFKHARASALMVSVSWDSEVLTVAVEDNGVGFSYDDMKMENKGLGLFNVENRVKVLGANLKYIKGANGKGTRAEITWQYEKT